MFISKKRNIGAKLFLVLDLYLNSIPSIRGRLLPHEAILFLQDLKKEDEEMEVIFVSSDGSPDELMKYFQVWSPSHFLTPLCATLTVHFSFLIVLGRDYVKMCLTNYRYRQLNGF